MRLDIFLISRALARGERLNSPPAPVLSLLGSSNLGHRSVCRDVELGACLVSTDDGVRRQLQIEQARLRQHTEPAPDEEAAVPLVARCAARALRSYF